ncbi:unnamed protein product [Scytosiphon promiscuus]
MGCQGSKQVGSAGRNEPEELAKCTAVSAEVRWSWLRARTLFSFAELRELLKLFRAAAARAAAAEAAEGPLQEHRLGGSTPAPICGVNIGGHGKSSSASSSSPGMVDKAQFLALCEMNDVFRLSEVVGAFGSRLFDVLDDNGDGLLAFETFAVGLSKLLKGPEREKLKLMYAAYDLSGVAPSEERKKSSSCSSGNGSGKRSLSDSGYGGRAKASKPPRRSKYLTVEDITEVLASASQAAAYPTLLSCTADGGGVITASYLGGGGGEPVGCCCGGGNPGDVERPGGQESASPPRNGRIDPSPSRDSLESGSCGSGTRLGSCNGGRINSARTSRDPEALAELLQEIARRNAAAYAERAVSEFGSQAQGGKAGRAGLTQKEFERWVLTGPVLRCRINEFSIDLNLAPFQGVQLS